MVAIDAPRVTAGNDRLHTDAAAIFAMDSFSQSSSALEIDTLSLLVHVAASSLLVHVDDTCSVSCIEGAAPPPFSIHLPRRLRRGR